MIASVSLPAMTDRITSSWPGLNWSRPNTCRIVRFSWGLMVAIDEGRATEVPLIPILRCWRPRFSACVGDEVHAGRHLHVRQRGSIDYRVGRDQLVLREQEGDECVDLVVAQ